MRRLLLVPWVLFAATACSHRKTDHLPSTGLTTEELVREQTAIARGEPVGAGLRRPAVVVDSRGIWVNEVRVGDPADVEATKLARSDKLRLYLNDLRDHWKQIRDGRDEWRGTIDITLEPTATAFTLANVMQSAMLAAYWRFRIKIGGIIWDSTMFILGPPPSEDADPLALTGFVLRPKDSGYEGELRVQGACRKAPAVFAGALALETLPARVRAVCSPTSRCHLAVEPTGAAIDLVRMLAPISIEGGDNLDLVWGTELPDENKLRRAMLGWTAPEVQPPPSASASPSPSPSSAREREREKGLSLIPRLGAVVGDPRLDADLVGAALQPHREALRACYQRARQTNPTLTGRVTLKVAVDVRGEVGEVCAETDLPDGRAVSCIEDAFARVRFTPPAGGIAQIRVPMMFSPPP